MQAIRNMEPAWEKVNGRKFALVEYKDAKGEMRPCFELTKTECLSQIYTDSQDLRNERAKLERTRMIFVQQISQIAQITFISDHGFTWIYTDFPKTKN